jgi:hypothetical protein
MLGQGDPTSLLHEVSSKRPAAITVYPDARSTSPRDAEIREFRSFEELARFFGRTPRKRADKRAVPLFARGVVEGVRLKKNMRPPYLVVLDVDESRTPLVACSKRLDLLGIAHVAHTTWSHGKRAGRHSYRVFLDLVADAWPVLESTTRQLFELAGVDETRESWSSPCFFVPAVEPSRSREYRFRRSETERSEWRPRPPSPEELEAPRGPRGPVADVDPGELRAALSRVDNSPREDWIAIGMALKSTGIEDARELWDEWSSGQGYGDYSDEAQDAAWDSFADDREGGVGVGTIFRMARLAGWRPPEERSDPVEDFAEHFEPRLRHLLELNRRYAYVAIGQGVVADLSDPDRAVDFKSTRAFLGLHAHPKIRTGKVLKDGTEVLDAVGKVWMDSWPKRRTFERVDFLPPGGHEVLSPGTLNLWRGWPSREEPSSCALYLRHAKEVICSGDEELWSWLQSWMAHLVQRPFEKAGTSVVLRGNEGVGKGVFASALVDLCGAHGLHVTQPKQLTGNFNSHMASKLLVFADEVTWGGRRQEEGVLKAMITERSVMLEPKGVDAFPARSFCRVIVSSNNEWVVPAGRTARRFQVLDVPDNRKGDFDYFKALTRETLLTPGFGTGLRLHLEGLDLESLPNPRTIVGTDALRDQKIESLDAKGQWLLTILRNGSLGGFSEKWPTTPVPATEVYESYLDAARAIGAPRRSVEMQVSAFLRLVFGEELAKGRAKAGDAKRLARAFSFPPLGDCREAFENWLGSSVDWEA